LLGRERGFQVTVLEKGRAGDALRRWGPTRLFSPFSMNVSSRVKALLGAAAPEDGALLTGPEMASTVLDPIAASLGSALRTGVRVVAVGRARLTRGDLAGHPVREERPFRLILETAAGEEILEADAVIDASGVYDTPCAAGAGGLPAIGERALGSSVLRTLGALADKRAELAGKRLLLVGHGHSAANALLTLDSLAREAPATRVVWATRSMNGRPCQEVAGDPLPERHTVVTRANDLAENPPAWLTVERRAHVERLAGKARGIDVALAGGRTTVVDAVVALTGYRPDNEFLSELAIEISPVSEGPGALHRAVSNVVDCLTLPKVGARDLSSGEAGFFFAGSKSYGRSRSFLLQTGLSQLESIFVQLGSGG
jgi:thioredoxin reductase